jgi:hypothetical protein
MWRGALIIAVLGVLIGSADPAGAMLIGPASCHPGGAINADSYYCGVSLVVAGKPVSADCRSEVPPPDGQTYPATSGCRVRAGATVVDANRCSGTATNDHGLWSSASTCRTGVDGNGYTCTSSNYSDTRWHPYYTQTRDCSVTGPTSKAVGQHCHNHEVTGWDGNDSTSWCATRVGTTATNVNSTCSEHFGGGSAGSTTPATHSDDCQTSVQVDGTTVVTCEHDPVVEPSVLAGSQVADVVNPAPPQTPHCSL